MSLSLKPEKNDCKCGSYAVCPRCEAPDGILFKAKRPADKAKISSGRLQNENCRKYDKYFSAAEVANRPNTKPCTCAKYCNRKKEI